MTDRKYPTLDDLGGADYITESFIDPETPFYDKDLINPAPERGFSLDEEKKPEQGIPAATEQPATPDGPPASDEDLTSQPVRRSNLPDSQLVREAEEDGTLDEVRQLADRVPQPKLEKQEKDESGPKYGWLGKDWGVMSPEKADKEITEIIATTDQTLEILNTKRDRMKTFADQNPNHPWVKELDKMIMDKVAEGMAAKEMQLGLTQKFTLGKGRASLENVISEFTRMYAMEISSLGTGLQMLKEKTGLGEVNYDENFLKDLGDGIREGVEKAFPGDPARQHQFLDKLTRGGGSMAAFYLAGGVAKAAGMSAKKIGVTVSLFGAGVEGQSLFEEASQNVYKDRALGLNSFQSEEARKAAFLWGSLFGLSEGLPIGHLFGQGRTFIKKALEQMLEEGLQEGFQQFGGNWTAKSLAGYDPKRKLSANVMEAAMLGAILGSMGGGGFAVVSYVANRNQNIAPFILYPEKIIESTTFAEKMAQEYDLSVDELRKGAEDFMTLSPQERGQALRSARRIARIARGEVEPSAEELAKMNKSTGIGSKDDKAAKLAEGMKKVVEQQKAPDDDVDYDVQPSKDEIDFFTVTRNAQVDLDAKASIKFTDRPHSDLYDLGAKLAANEAGADLAITNEERAHIFKTFRDFIVAEPAAGLPFEQPADVDSLALEFFKRESAKAADVDGSYEAGDMLVNRTARIKWLRKLGERFSVDEALIEGLGQSEEDLFNEQVSEEQKDIELLEHEIEIEEAEIENAKALIKEASNGAELKAARLARAQAVENRDRALADIGKIKTARDKATKKTPRQMKEEAAAKGQEKRSERRWKPTGQTESLTPPMEAQKRYQDLIYTAMKKHNEAVEEHGSSSPQAKRTLDRLEDVNQLIKERLDVAAGKQAPEKPLEGRASQLADLIAGANENPATAATLKAAGVEMPAVNPQDLIKQMGLDLDLADLGGIADTAQDTLKSLQKIVGDIDTQETAIGDYREWIKAIESHELRQAAQESMDSIVAGIRFVNKHGESIAKLGDNPLDMIKMMPVLAEGAKIAERIDSSIDKVDRAVSPEDMEQGYALYEKYGDELRNLYELSQGLEGIKLPDNLDDLIKGVGAQDLEQAAPAVEQIAETKKEQQLVTRTEIAKQTKVEAVTQALESIEGRVTKAALFDAVREFKLIKDHADEKKLANKLMAEIKLELIARAGGEVNEQGEPNIRTRKNADGVIVHSLDDLKKKFKRVKTVKADGSSGVISATALQRVGYEMDINVWDHRYRIHGYRTDTNEWTVVDKGIQKGNVGYKWSGGEVANKEAIPPKNTQVAYIKLKGQSELLQIPMHKVEDYIDGHWKPASPNDTAPSRPIVGSKGTKTTPRTRRAYKGLVTIGKRVVNEGKRPPISKQRPKGVSVGTITTDLAGRKTSAVHPWRRPHYRCV